VSGLQTTTLEGMLESHLTRRLALRTAGVFTMDAVLRANGIQPVAAQEGTPAALEAYPEVVITAADFRFELPASIPGGLTRLTMKNVGDAVHHAMFMRLNDDASLDDFEAALTQPDPGQLFATAQSLGGPVAGPGLQATTGADLTPGQYAVICAAPELDGRPHYMRGMGALVEVTEPAAAATAPVGDMTVDLLDFAFKLPSAQVATGPQTWKASNVGDQPHEMLVLQLAPDASVDQVTAVLDMLPEAGTPTAGEAIAAPRAAGPPPFVVLGGVAPMSPGVTAWAVLDLQAGEYALACLVPDPSSGKPHYALGMFVPFTVG
jgi:hypothetical protein